MNSVTILDGGFSAQLANNIGDIIDGDPLWSCRYLATKPEAVLQTHLDFLNAGAEVIITNSYQASIPGFMKYLGMNEFESRELIKKSVRIARHAVEIYKKNKPYLAKEPKVAASVGPYGAYLHDGSEYTGSYADTVDANIMMDWHRPRISALVEEGVDFLAVETIPALKEAEAILSMIRDEFPRQKLWLSFQCKDGVHTAHGDIFKDAVQRCWKMHKNQLVAIGCNCVNPKFVSNLIGQINEGRADKIPLIVYPNSGEEYSHGFGWLKPEVSCDFTRLVGRWLTYGVRYIGGCCRTDVRHVKIIKDAVNIWRLKLD